MQTTKNIHHSLTNHQKSRNSFVVKNNNSQPASRKTENNAGSKHSKRQALANWKEKKRETNFLTLLFKKYATLKVHPFNLGPKKILIPYPTPTN